MWNWFNRTEQIFWQQHKIFIIALIIADNSKFFLRVLWRFLFAAAICLHYDTILYSSVALFPRLRLYERKMIDYWRRYRNMFQLWSAYLVTLITRKFDGSSKSEIVLHILAKIGEDCNYLDDLKRRTINIQPSQSNFFFFFFFLYEHEEHSNCAIKLRYRLMSFEYAWIIKVCRLSMKLCRQSRKTVII